jgi:hypothetical protein
MHSRSLTRWIHLVGTMTGFVVAALGVITGHWLLMFGLPVLGYATAWPAHWLIEKNNPASFGNPAWSFRGDISMIVTMLQGHDASLAETARGWLAAHPEDRSRGSLVTEVHAA